MKTSVDVIKTKVERVNEYISQFKEAQENVQQAKIKVRSSEMFSNSMDKVKVTKFINKEKSKARQAIEDYFDKNKQEVESERSDSKKNIK